MRPPLSGDLVTLRLQPFLDRIPTLATTLLNSADQLVDVALSLPALLVGSVLGIVAFHNVNEATFRRIILFVLLLSGVLLVM